MTDPTPETEEETRHLLVEALRTIERLNERLATREPARASEPIAIVSMGCRLPGGAESPERFWELLRDGVDATAEFPANRADASAFFDPDPDVPGKAYTTRGGFLSSPVDRFEPEVFGISPA